MSDVTILRTWTLQTDETTDVTVEAYPSEQTVSLKQEGDHVVLDLTMAYALLEKVLSPAIGQAEGVDA